MDSATLTQKQQADSMRVIIHTNPALKNQTEFAEYLRLGFAQHGLQAEITADIYQPGDLHVVQGPHYAKAQWLGHERTLLLERGWWGDPEYHVALAWMDHHGGLKIRVGCNNDRERPELQPWKRDAQNPKVLLILDYGMRPTPQLLQELSRFKVTIRPHPSDYAPVESLEQAFAHHDFVVGFGSTALVKAAIAGLPVVCLDRRNPVWPIASNHYTLTRPTRDGWLKNLSYHQWSGAEIADGSAWAFLRTGI